MGMYLQLHALDPAAAERLAAEPEGMEELLDEDPESSDLVSLEKAWHGLHFLLTGSAEGGDPPLNFLLKGGTPVGEDLGYGEPRLLAPAEVRQMDAALAGLSADQLWARFDPARMKQEGIYPGIWDEPEAELREEYVGYFQELKRLVHAAAGRGQALLVALT